MGNEAEQRTLDNIITAEDKVLQNVCDMLRGYESNINSWLAYYVASICNVDVNKMLSRSNVMNVAQARWLYWYALRYMTGQSYPEIAENTFTTYHARFAKQGVGQAINKMSMMIDRDLLWNRRWTMVKRIIKACAKDVDNTSQQSKESAEITITYPSNISIKLIKQDK